MGANARADFHGQAPPHGSFWLGFVSEFLLPPIFHASTPSANGKDEMKMMVGVITEQTRTDRKRWERVEDDLKTRPKDGARVERASWALIPR